MGCCGARSYRLTRDFLCWFLRFVGENDRRYLGTGNSNRVAGTEKPFWVMFVLYIDEVVSRVALSAGWVIGGRCGTIVGDGV